MKIHTIDYKKHFWNDWTVYRQTVKIDSELMEKYNNQLDREYMLIWNRVDENKTLSMSDMETLCYTKKLTKWINFLKHTGLVIFWNVIFDWWIDEKNRLKFNRNTIVEVL